MSIQQETILQDAQEPVEAVKIRTDRSTFWLTSLPCWETPPKARWQQKVDKLLRWLSTARRYLAYVLLITILLLYLLYGWQMTWTRDEVVESLSLLALPVLVLALFRFQELLERRQELIPAAGQARPVEIERGRTGADGSRSLFGKVYGYPTDSPAQLPVRQARVMLEFFATGQIEVEREPLKSDCLQFRLAPLPWEDLPFAPNESSSLQSKFNTLLRRTCYPMGSTRSYDLLLSLQERGRQPPGHRLDKSVYRGYVQLSAAHHEPQEVVCWADAGVLYAAIVDIQTKQVLTGLCVHRDLVDRVSFHSRAELVLDWEDIFVGGAETVASA